MFLNVKKIKNFIHVKKKNNAAMNTLCAFAGARGQVFLQVIHPGQGMMGCRVCISSASQADTKVFPKELGPIHSLAIGSLEFLLFRIYAVCRIVRIFYFYHPAMSIEIHHCGLNLNFLTINEVEHLFRSLLTTRISSL